MLLQITELRTKEQGLQGKARFRLSRRKWFAYVVAGCPSQEALNDCLVGDGELGLESKNPLGLGFQAIMGTH